MLLAWMREWRGSVLGLKPSSREDAVGSRIVVENPRSERWTAKCPGRCKKVILCVLYTRCSD